MASKMRLLLLRYLLYDALLRPGAWTQALLNDRDRTAAWAAVITELLRRWGQRAEKRQEGGDGLPRVVFLSGEGAFGAVGCAFPTRQAAGARLRAPAIDL